MLPSGVPMMRSRFLLLPAAVVMAAAPAQADNFLTIEQAQKLLFPDATLTPADFTMSEHQVDQLISVTGSTVYRSKVRAWRASTGGWFFVDQVPGRDDRVTYALALEPNGTVRGVEVLIGLAQYGAIRDPEWRGHFKGRQHTKGKAADLDIPLVSGQTLTTAHVGDGINRLLATYALFMGSHGK